MSSLVSVVVLIIEIEFFVELYSGRPHEIVLPCRKEHIMEVALGILYRNWLAWPQYRIDCRDRIFFCRLILIRSLLDEFDIFAIEAIEDHFVVQRFFVVKIDNLDRINTEVDEFIDLVQVDLIASPERRFCSPSISI